MLVLVVAANGSTMNPISSKELNHLTAFWPTINQIAHSYKAVMRAHFGYFNQDAEFVKTAMNVTYDKGCGRVI
jgi:hypothetical protein